MACIISILPARWEAQSFLHVSERSHIPKDLAATLGTRSPLSTDMCFCFPFAKVSLQRRSSPERGRKRSSYAMSPLRHMKSLLNIGQPHKQVRTDGKPTMYSPSLFSLPSFTVRLQSSEWSKKIKLTMSSSAGFLF